MRDLSGLIRSNIVFLLIVLLLLLIYTTAFSQNQPDEERRQQFLNDSARISAPKAIRPQFKFDTRTTVYADQKINMYGYDAGVLVKNKLRLTLGYYRIDDRLSKHIEISDVEAEQNLYVRSGTINTELVYFNKRFFSLGFPLEVGAGYYRIKNIAVDTRQEINRLKGLTVFSNFGLSGTFTPIHWLGLKVIAGYRKAVLSSNHQFDFNGIFTSIGLNINMEEAVRDIKMYRLKKRYYRNNFKRLETFSDIIVK